MNILKNVKWPRRGAAVVLFAAAVGLPTGSYAQPPITALAFAPDGQTLVAGSQAGLREARWPALTTERQLPAGFAQVHDLRFSPAGDRLLVVGGAAGEHGAWRLLSWPERLPVADGRGHDDVIYSAVWLSDDRFVTGGADNNLIEWRSADGRFEPAQTLRGHARRVLCVEMIGGATGGHRLLMSAGLDQSLRVWETTGAGAAGEPLRSLDNHTDAVCGLAARPGDHAVAYLASAGLDRTVRLWQPSIGRMVRFARLPVEPCSIAWSHDGGRLAAACADGGLRIIDLGSGVVEQSLDAISGWAYEVAAAADGSFAVGGTAGAVVRVAPQKPR